MKQVIQNPRGELTVEEVPIPSVKSNWLLVKNFCSVISIGTEKMMVKSFKESFLKKALKRQDDVKEVLKNIKEKGIIDTYRRINQRLDNPDPLGYSCAGIVVEVGDLVEGFAPQDKVACGGAGWANHAEFVCVPKNLCVKIPEGVSMEEAAFTTIGSIALNGVRQAQVSIGDNVVVIGLGLIGLLTVQLLKSAGCKVLGIDINEKKVNLACELGAENGIIPKNINNVVKLVKQCSKGYGADAVIITAATPTNEPIRLAGEICRDRGRIVIVGVVGMNIPYQTYYNKELSVVLSRSYGPGRYDKIYEEEGIDYPIGYIRWTEQRNMEEFLNLVVHKNVKFDKIITHRFGIEDAEMVYKTIIEEKDEPVGILFTYDKESKPTYKVILKEEPGSAKLPKGIINVGVIGAGSFAHEHILPYLKNSQDVILRGVCTKNGINAKVIGKRFKFQYSTTNPDEIFNDQEIDAVVIATRHNLHAQFVIKGLTNSKIIFLEKPLALNNQELNEIIRIYKENNGQVMVDFNRRFSPLICRIKEEFKERSTPLFMHYRINAGFLPKNNWYQDPIEGGGRVIGECCHFIDLFQYLTDSEPINVYAQTLPIDNCNIVAEDNVAIILKFKDGSIGTINYIACGDTSLPKERIEIFGDNKVAIIDNFKKSLFIKDGKKNQTTLKKIDKGHKNGLSAFIQAIKKGLPLPIDFKDSILTTRVTFKIVESLHKNKPCEIDTSI